MPDHVHLIIQPLPAQEPQIGRVTEYYSLSEIVKGIKGASARDINLVLGRRGPLWQDERWDRLLRNEHEYLEKYRYILYNPVKARLIEAFQEYPFYVFPPEVEAERRAFRLRG
jgi:REP element-mobilizing transposase RayT